MNRDEYRASGARICAKRGEDLPQAKISEADVAAIRKLHARKQRLIQQLNERYSTEALAKAAGVSRRTVERILAREIWSHVP